MNEPIKPLDNKTMYSITDPKHRWKQADDIMANIKRGFELIHGICWTCSLPLKEIDGEMRCTCYNSYLDGGR